MSRSAATTALLFIGFLATRGLARTHRVSAAAIVPPKRYAADG